MALKQKKVTGYLLCPDCDLGSSVWTLSETPTREKSPLSTNAKYS